jgi:hypothetical protein
VDVSGLAVALHQLAAEVAADRPMISPSVPDACR